MKKPTECPNFWTTPDGIAAMVFLAILATVVVGVTLTIIF